MGKILPGPRCGLQHSHRMDKVNKMLFSLLSHSLLTIQDSFIQFQSSYERSFTKPTWHLYRPTLSHCCDDGNGVRMTSKMRKIDSECRIFNPEWTSKYFVTHVGSKAVHQIIVFHDTVSFMDMSVTLSLTGHKLRRSSKIENA